MLRSRIGNHDYEISPHISPYLAISPHILGNHDYEAPDWRCGCLSDPKQCHQVQKHGARHRNTSWYMPSTYYHARPLPGVNIEARGRRQTSAPLCTPGSTPLPPARLWRST